MKGPGLVAALIVAAVSAVPAQQPPAGPSQVPAPFRSSTSLVALNVTVTDSATRFVSGLQAEDFAVYEDGVQQRVQFFESRDVPIDLILLIDASSSMRDKMRVVHEAALGFLETLRDGDRGAIVAFNDTVNIAQPLTTDRAALTVAVRGTRAHGATALHNAIYISLKEFGRSAPQGSGVRRQAIAVLSDGEDTSSLVSFDDVLGLARRSGVGIYPIRLESPYESVRAMVEKRRKYFSESAYSMKTLARDTGGQAYFPAAIGELKSVYAVIAQELSTQYSIGYTPTNARRDGRFRRIVVRLPTQPELKPRARAGYTAEAERTAAVVGSRQ